LSGFEPDQAIKNEHQFKQDSDSFEPYEIIKFWSEQFELKAKSPRLKDVTPFATATFH